MYDSVEIAKRIKQTSKAQKKSVSEVLSACGLGKNTVAKINAGTDILTLNFAKIADELNCSVDYLLGRTDDPSPEAQPHPPHSGVALTDHEHKVITAYRANPDMQASVDRLLQVEEDYPEEKHA